MAELALETGIPPSVWAAEGTRMVDTVFELLDERRRQAERRARG